MASFTVQSPEPFPFSSPSEWPKWKNRFERFRVASGLTSKDEEDQVNTLIYLMGEQADNIFTSFKMSAADAKKYGDVLKKFDAHFVVKKNVIYERAKFNSRIQTQGESVASFIDDLHKLAETCEYGTLNEELIRDRIVVGVSNRRLSEKLQLETKLTLQSAVTTARQHEEVSKQQDEIHAQGLNQSVNSVTKTSHGKQGQNSNSGQSKSKFVHKSNSSHEQKKNNTRQFSDVNCFWCGFGKKHKKTECPAKDSKCNKCQKLGHYAKVCKSSAVHEVSDTQIETVFCGAVTADKTVRERWSAEVKIGGIDISFKLDPGADVSVIPYLIYLKYLKKRFPKLEESDRKLSGPDGKRLTTAGMIHTKISHKDINIESAVYVVKGLDRSLLGVTECENLNLVKRLCEVKSESSVDPYKEYPSIFKGLGEFSSPYEIKLRSDSKPFAVYTPRRVPIPLLKTLKLKIDSMVEREVIRPVEEATEWCAPLVLAPKPNNDIRICVDLTQLNKCVLREILQMNSVESTLGLLKGAKYFSKMDTTDGFWQVPITEESKKLTTFITPFGRFQFNRLPFGITSAPEHFQRKMTAALKGIQGVVVFTDDVLVFAPTLEEHDKILRQVLDRLKNANVTLKREKCVFGVTKVKYLGHIVDEHGIRPNPDKVEAIMAMSPPSDVSGVRRFMGMVNHLGKFVPELAEIGQPLYALTKSNCMFLWGPAQEKAFNQIKSILTSDPVLAIFDPNRPTIISADASSYGLGAALIQLDDKKNRRVIAYASRTMTETEKRYAQIEREALAFTWASERFQEFVIGLTFLVETDHKPLIPIFSSKRLDELPPRLQRFRMRMMRFSFDIKHIPGKELIVADTLSRNPLPDVEEDANLEDAAYIRGVIASLPATQSKIQEIKRKQAEDPILQKLRPYISLGWPDKKSLSPIEQKYWEFRGEIVDQDGLLMRGCRMIIPSALQPEMLNRIHTGHLGITKCRARAIQALWWPGISSQIEKLIKSCVECLKHHPNRHEPLIPTKFPSRPWEIVAMDLLKYAGKWWLVVYDYYSRYPEYALLSSLSSRSIIQHLKSIFARHGVPDEVRSDGGPQFEPTRTSEFQQFAREWDFKHTVSSPLYAQSNGMAEAGVKILKQLFKKNDDPYKALLEYRSSPISNGLSPSQLLMNRRLKTNLPIHPSLLIPKPIAREEISAKEERRIVKQKENYDKHHGVYPKADLTPGDIVWVKDKKTWGTVKEKVAPRSFLVDTPSSILRRNTFHLQYSDQKEIPEEEIDPGIPVEVSQSSHETFQIPLEPPVPQPAAANPGPSKGRNVKTTRSGRVVVKPQRYGYEEENIASK